MALALSTRDLMVETWMDSARRAYAGDSKRVYYLSMEFLIGRSLIANLLATGSLGLARGDAGRHGPGFRGHPGPGNPKPPWATAAWAGWPPA